MTFRQFTSPYGIIIADFKQKTSRLYTCLTKNQLSFVHFNEILAIFSVFYKVCSLFQNAVAAIFYTIQKAVNVAISGRPHYNKKEVLQNDP